jgi:hypothetical protein
MSGNTSNARQIPAAESLDLLRFLFFQELSETEWAAYKELVRQAKEKEKQSKINEKNGYTS